MSISADRKPSLISWSAQFRLDTESVDKNFSEAGKKLADLLNQPFEKYPAAFRIKRGKSVFMVLDAAAAFRRAEIEMVADQSDVASAPEGMQKLFLDLGIQESDEIAIGLMLAKRRPRANPQKFAESVYKVTLVPTVYRPDLLGIEFNYAHQFGFLKSGTPIDRTEPADLWYGSERVRDMSDAYALLMEGTVYDAYSEGTHASITRYRHKPHAYIALIHKNTAEWISDLVQNRTSK